VFNNGGECLYVSSALQAGDVNYSPLPEEAAYVIFVLTNVGNSAIQYVYDSGYMASEDAVVSESPAMSLTCYPNPFTAAGSSLQIRANNLKSSATSNAIQIYNLKGQLVRTLTLSKTAGQDTWQTTWDGLDARQAAVSSGVYMIRYSKGNSLLNKSILYLK
jgi:hypothetical protein